MLRIAFVILAVGFTASVSSICQAQQAASSADSAKVYVAYRMDKWKAKHIHDSEQAQKHADTLRTLGCEVRTKSHNGHLDVECRTVFWKSLAVDTHEKAHQWISWLQSSGFETIHGYKLGTHQSNQAGQREAVQYRLTDWKSRHIHDPKELNQLLALYRGLGVEIQQFEHNGHNDVKARCPNWMEIQLTSHDAAHAWTKFLADSGFETKHVH